MEVSVNHLARTEWRFMYLAAILVTALFYFILGYFQTANLVPSTLSVTTSFIAVYLTYKRSPYYALGVRGQRHRSHCFMDFGCPSKYILSVRRGMLYGLSRQ